MRTNDPSSFGSAPRSSRRILLTRANVSAFIIAVYLGVAVGGALLFSYVASVRGSQDNRDEQVSVVFAVLAFSMCAGSLFKLFRRRRSPDPR